MTDENQVKLLTAYRLATIAKQHDIAELLGDVILDEMKELRKTYERERGVTNE